MSFILSKTPSPDAILFSELAEAVMEVTVPDDQSFVNDGFTGENLAIGESVSASLSNTIRTVVEQHYPELDQNEADLTVESALMGVLLSGNTTEVVEQNIVPPADVIGRGRADSIVTVLPQEDISAAQSRELASECFNPQVSDNLKTHTCRFNLEMSAADELVRAVAPLILFDPSEAGIVCELEFTYIQDDFSHKVSGNIPELNRRSLVQALVDPSILAGKDISLVPVVRTGGDDPSVDKFIPNSEIAFQDTETNGVAVQTGVLKTNTEIDIIGISQDDKTVAQGGRNSSDVLHQFANIKALYARLDAGKYLKINTLGNTTAAFVPVRQGDVSGMIATYTGNFMIDKDTKYTNGTLVSADIPELDPANTGGKEYRIFVRVGALGEVDSLSTGVVNVTGTKFKIVGIYDQDDNSLPLDSADAIAIRDAIVGSDATDAKCRIVGWDPDFYLQDLNKKLRGDLLGRVRYRELMYIPVSGPVSCPREVGSRRTPEETKGLITQSRAKLNNDTVKFVLDSFLRIKQYKANTMPGAVPDSLGIARFVVNPTAIYDTVDVATNVIGLSSADRFIDISAVITNTLSLAIHRMWYESGMNSVTQLLGSSRTGTKERIVILADTELAPYLVRLGDNRLLGDMFDVLPVFTDNMTFKGKIAAFPSNPVVNNKCDCLRFAHTGWSPETVLNLDLPVNGGVENVLSVYTRARAFLTNPVMTMMDVTNIEAAYGPTGG